MFHLKPTRFALPSGAKEKTLAGLHMPSERWGCWGQQGVGAVTARDIYGCVSHSVVSDSLRPRGL